MKPSIQTINTTNRQFSAHRKNPRRNNTLKIGLLALCSIFSSAINAAAPPPTPTGATLTTAKGTFTQPPQITQPVQTGQPGLFPGTNLRFYPGFVIAGTENEATADIEDRWQQLFKGQRKETYRPEGIYGGVTRRLNWNRFYADQYKRPADPTDHADPAYDWRLLDAIFNINAVKNEGALVSISVSEVGYSGAIKAPMWLANPPYNGIFNAGIDGGSGRERKMPKYYRYNGPDIRGQTNVGEGPSIVDEFLYFMQAMRDHLINKRYNNGRKYIDKVMFVTMSEFYVSSKANLPSDYNDSDLVHGIGTRAREIAKIWAKSQIQVNISSLTGSRRDTLWRYMGNPNKDNYPLGLTFPDMKMSGTNNISASDIRFRDLSGTEQKDIRPLSEGTGGNGQRFSTYFASGIPNPWGYSNVTKPQTASHILWVLSGAPKGMNKDSRLGQTGDDPSGILPVHTVIMDFGRSWQDNSPDVEEWHKAIETFGPPGTFAFPYLPPGYVP